MGPSPRVRRLHSDQRSLKQLRADSSILQYVAMSGSQDAPESYLITFHGRGLWRGDQGEILVRERHEVLIKLGAAYPRSTPELGWRTPIFHPNISAGGAVCLGGYGTHWTPSLMLDELCAMLWDMIRYQNYDVDSPYNREAATWAKGQAQFALPVDSRPIRDRVAGEAPQRQLPPIVGRPVPVERHLAGLHDTNMSPQGGGAGWADLPVLRPVGPAPRLEPEVLFLDTQASAPSTHDAGRSPGLVDAEIVEAEIIEAEIVADSALEFRAPEERTGERPSAPPHSDTARREPPHPERRPPRRNESQRPAEDSDILFIE